MDNNDYRAYVECDYNSVYHYGVPGTHWGDRKGPPYPLNYDWHTYYLKRKSGRTGGSTSRSSRSDSKPSKSSKQTKSTDKPQKVDSRAKLIAKQAWKDKGKILKDEIGSKVGMFGYSRGSRILSNKLFNSNKLNSKAISLNGKAGKLLGLSGKKLPVGQTASRLIDLTRPAIIGAMALHDAAGTVKRLRTYNSNAKKIQAKQRKKRKQNQE